MRHPDTFQTLTQALRDPAPRRVVDFDRTPRGKASAAVLMLFSDASDPEVTLLTRSSSLRRHAGQMALPGGRRDPEDPSLVATALREASEETGLDPRAVEVLGSLPAVWVPASNYDVTTVTGVWPGGSLSPMDPFETAAVHAYPVSLLTSPEVRVTATHPSGYRGPAFVLGDEFVWGLTAHLLDWVLDLAGWARPWDQGQTSTIPERFMRD
ncbi:NUDIX hydrolase [Tessaracoccus caeni]|uniref:NUDIX hydrolase n=1 Tax=Tessaracoccus caeni TaxID=3031239 RepID=UPI0023DB5EAB|nr:CoA pyrophosphatase [Tessaracoccus caeni]MDF1490071.1 CoA pyrophosphatase [Tessaracoccus caeni]